MAWNGQPPQGPWDFFHNTPTQPNGIGIDHTAAAGPSFPPGFPFGPAGFNPWAHHRGGWGWGGGPPGRHEWGGRHRHGRRHRRGGDEEPPYTDGEQGEDTAMLSEHEKEKEGSPETMRATPGGEHPDPPESVPQGPQFGGRHGHGHGHGFRGRGRCGGRGGMRGHHHGPPPPHFGGGGAMPWAGMMAGFAQSPFGQGLRDYLDRAAQGDANNNNANNNENAEEDVESFQPPVDVFHTANGWVLHIAVPGAKKEDVGVNWDADKGTLSVSGVVYRPGDEEFLKGLINGERKVGLFKREVKLPPAGEEKGEKGEKDEVDGEGIRAKMEDGVLMVSVPVVEREWTEVRKVDIL